MEITDTERKPMAILGAAFLKNVYSVYDIEQQRVGLAGLSDSASGKTTTETLNKASSSVTVGASGSNALPSAEALSGTLAEGAAVTDTGESEEKQHLSGVSEGATNGASGRQQEDSNTDDESGALLASLKAAAYIVVGVSSGHLLW